MTTTKTWSHDLVIRWSQQINWFVMVGNFSINSLDSKISILWNSFLYRFIYELTIFFLISKLLQLKIQILNEIIVGNFEFIITIKYFKFESKLLDC